MRGYISIDNLDKVLPLLKSLNDNVRIVDPIKNIVIDNQGMEINETEEKCFSSLCQKELCENCISKNAYLQNSSLIKFVSSSDSIILVTAIPVEKAGIPLVLETFNDVTTSIVFDAESTASVRDNLEAVWMLDDMATKDQLTSLYNRRFADVRLAAVLQNAYAKHNPVSVLFLDIDDLKNINDNYGHEVGDHALQKAANVFAHVVREKSDWVARFGGDEFVICLNHADENTAKLIAKRICYGIKKVKIPIDGNNLRFTVSIGAHTMQKKKLSAAEIIRIADKNMYKSKSEGKNRITISVS